jgi:hypothetical protein
MVEGLTLTKLRRSSLISNDLATETACLVSPGSDSTADTKLRHSREVSVLLSPSVREQIRDGNHDLARVGPTTSTRLREWPLAPRWPDQL